MERSAELSNASERRASGQNGLEIRDLEQRIISGPVVPYGAETRVGGYTESFARGAFDGTDTGNVPLLVSHRHADLPVGRSLALTDGESALTGEFQLSNTRDADEIMTLANDGVPLGLSVGFKPIEDKWNQDRTKVVRVRAYLGEVSVVGMPQYQQSRVMSVRADEQGANALARSPRLTIARLARP
jgi:HK97 family phage prohead protease